MTRVYEKKKLLYVDELIFRDLIFKHLDRAFDFKNFESKKHFAYEYFWPKISKQEVPTLRNLIRYVFAKKKEILFQHRFLFIKSYYDIVVPELPAPQDGQVGPTARFCRRPRRQLLRVSS